MRKALPASGGRSGRGRRRPPRTGPVIVLLLMMAAGVAGAAAEREGNYAGRPLLEALQALRDRGLRLIYSSDVVTPDMIVTHQPSGRRRRTVLDALLAPHGLEVREGPGGTLLIVRRGSDHAAGSIGGTVRTRDGRHPVRGARIALRGTGQQATSAPDGTFHITEVPHGAYDLVVRVPGLRREIFRDVVVRPGAPTRVTLDLEAIPGLLETIVVTPDRNAPAIDGPHGAKAIDGGELRKLPGVGEDVHRALAWQPGTAAPDRSAALSVHGGEPNEILVLLDGLELYDPFHLKHFQTFSGIIDTMAVGHAEFFPGTFPAEYGDRLSGVLDLSSSVPIEPGRTSIGTSFVNSRLLSGGRFGPGGGNWLIGARAWHTDAVVRVLDQENEGFSPSYYDLLGKVEVPVGRRSTLGGNVLAARDVIDFADPEGDESVSADSGTRYAWLTLKTAWSSRLSSKFLVSLGRIHHLRSGQEIDESGSMASLDDTRAFDVIGFDQGWTYERERWLLKGGVRARWMDADYRYAFLSTDAASDRVVAYDPSGRQFGAHLSGRIQAGARVQIEAGARWDRQSTTRESEVSPRLSVVADLGGSTRFRAGWGRYHQSQGLHELQVEDGVTRFLPAQRADQWSAGIEHSFGPGLSFRADAYWRRLSRVRPRFENLFNAFELVPEFETDRALIQPEEAEAKGVDLSLTMDRGGPVAWWVSYARSTAVDVIGGERIPRSWDQPHAFRFGVQLRRRDDWELTLAGVVHSGWPRTPVIAATVTDPDGGTSVEPAPGPRNSARYPAYHRLDLRASRTFRLPAGRLILFADVTNLYGRDNVCCTEDATLVPDGAGGFRVAREDGFWLQRVPAVGLVWEFDH